MRRRWTRPAAECHPERSEESAGVLLEKPMSLITTSSQTVGPYLKIGFEALVIEELAPAGAAGERITLTGRLLDGDGKPVNDGVVEIWQANASGKYSHPEDAQD